MKVKDEAQHIKDSFTEDQIKKMWDLTIPRAMTPQEKAKELFDLYLNVGMGDGWAKECALIAAEEIKEQLIQNIDNDVSALHAIYWLKVKDAIKEL